MPELLRSVITEVGPDVADLVAGGVLILFATGAPPELAEVSVLHTAHATAPEAPQPGASLRIGPLSTTLTAVGELAWAKVRDIGHVVITFNGADEAQRPGELCAATVDLDALTQALQAGTDIVIST